MSDMEETPGASEASESAEAPGLPEGHVTTPRRVIGTPPSAPRLLGGPGDRNGAEAAAHGRGGVAIIEHDGEKLPVESDYLDPITAGPRRSWCSASCSRSSRAAGSSPPTWPRGYRGQGLPFQPGPRPLAFCRTGQPGPRRADLGPAADAGRGDSRGTARDALDPTRAGRVPGVLRGGRGGQPVRQAADGTADADARHAAARRHPDRAAPRLGPAAGHQPRYTVESW